MRDFEQAEMGSNLGLQSSRHHHSKALDEIYTINACSLLGHGVEATPAADLCHEIRFVRGFQDGDIFSIF